MSATANLAITYITAAQNQKEVTANAAFDKIEDVLTEPLAVSVASGNAAPTAAEVRAMAVMQISGATTTGRTVTWPLVKRPFVARLDAASTKTVSIVRGTASFAIYPGCAAHFYADGTANGLTRLGEFGPRETTHWVRGVPSNGEIVARWQVREACTLLPDLLGWDAEADTAATATTVFEVRKNGTQVGTLTWAASGTVPTLATTGNAAVSFAAGNFIDIKAPATADATLADIFINTMLVRG